MSDIDFDAARQSLLDERRRILDAIEYLKRPEGTDEQEPPETDNGGEGNHPADSASVTYDRELDDGLQETDEQTLEQIDRALGRITAGTYGTCERCGKPIGAERLAARPWASLCIDDQRLSDQG